MQEASLTHPAWEPLRRWIAPAAVLVLVLLGGLIPLLVNKQDIWNLFFLFCLYFVLGQSWNILAGFCGQTSLGHAAFLALARW